VQKIPILLRISIDTLTPLTVQFRRDGHPAA
jgi:hypothetical protein